MAGGELAFPGEAGAEGGEGSDGPFSGPAEGWPPLGRGEGRGGVESRASGGTGRSDSDDGFDDFRRTIVDWTARGGHPTGPCESLLVRSAQQTLHQPPSFAAIDRPCTSVLVRLIALK